MTAHILVVDDEPDVEALILQKFRHKIRDGAIRFLFARDGVEALAALKANGQIDLVVTDINMPRMDGLSLLQKLQENEKQVSTIIVSAYGDMGMPTSWQPQSGTGGAIHRPQWSQR
jgi:adenylate cyclase